MSVGESRVSHHGRLALAFARSLVAGEFNTAHDLLAPSLRIEFPPEELKQAYEQMFEYAGETAADAVDVTVSIEDWPDKLDQEIGFAYVSISGPDKITGGVWVEGVGLYVSDYGGVLLISGIVWGRP